MKRLKFEKEKAKYEKMKKRSVTDGEFDQILRKRRAPQWIGVVLAFILGVAMIAEWPAPSLGPLTVYVGWAIVIILLVDLVRDVLMKEGLFYGLDRWAQNNRVARETLRKKTATGAAVQQQTCATGT